ITLNKYTPFWADSPDVIDVSGIDALKNSTYFEMDKSKPNFLNRFKELFPESKPVTATYSCYTTLAAILDAFKTNPPSNSVEAIESLNKLESFMTLDGSLQIKNRETQYKVVAKTFDGKTWN
ncbi:MAG: hypothetical protein H6619_06980, partial [Deltaproteobacteria bacterium]|nr:hypothetical protein [Deltaproteobacteria bacterium]